MTAAALVRDRRARLGCCGVLLMALSGCRWLPLHRPDAGLDPRALSKIDANRPADPPRIAVNDGSRESVPLPNLPLQQITASEALAERASTPLLDAGLKRAVAIEEATAAAVDPAIQETVLQEPAEPPVVEEPRPPVVVETIVPAPRAQPEDAWQLGMEALLTLAREQALREVESGKLGDWSAREQLLIKLAQADGTLWQTIVDALAHAQTDQAEDEEPTPAEPSAPEVEALALVELQFCRSVEGFGVYETSAAEDLGAGRMVGLYWEIEGLRSEALSDGQQRTRLETTVEILPVGSETAIWSQALGPAEDRCRRVRRDFFVNTRLTLPETLEPGEYRLRLSVEDSLAAARTARELPFRVGR